MPSVKTTNKVPEFTKVDTADVLFDSRNPRLGGAARKLSQPALQQILMSEPHYANELVDSFVENGFIEYEPLVVRQDGKKYVVIEGNRRLAAVKHVLAHPVLYSPIAVDRLKKVPVLIFRQPDDTSHLREMLTYLGVRHLLGLREWPAEAKALFLDQNIKTKADVKRIQREYSLKRADISRYLVPFRMKKAAASLLDDFQTSEDQSFWMLGEALQRSGVREYIKLDIDRDSLRIRGFDKNKVEFLLEFLYGSATRGKSRGGRATGTARISDTRHLTRLARVLQSKRASQELENGKTLEEAELYVSTPQETIDGLISEIRILLQRVIALTPSDAQMAEVEQCLVSFKKAMGTLSDEK